MTTLGPVPRLETSRLRLEPLGPEHLDGTLALLADPETRRLTGTRTTFPRAQVLAHLTAVGAQHDRLDWAVLRADDGGHLGEVVLHEHDSANRTIEFRIALGPAAVGRGYGSEVTRAVVAHAFDTVGLHRIGLEVSASNARALRAYAAVGFVEEGRAREAHLDDDGGRVDVVRMGLLATDPRG